jgi:hypothetical protein
MELGTSARVVISAARGSDGSDLATAAKEEAGAHDAFTITGFRRTARPVATLWA